MANKNVWKETRRRHLDIYPECRICGEISKSNHVHHLMYRGTENQRGLYERPGDLVTFCAFHHNNFHKKYPTSDKPFGSKRNYIKETKKYIRETLISETKNLKDKDLASIYENDRMAEAFDEFYEKALADD